MTSKLSLANLPPDARRTVLGEYNSWLKTRKPQARIEWALSYLPGNHVVSSSFGVQSAVMLHLVTLQRPNIPVLLMDTGYLFPETYRFVDQLKERLNLNLRVFRAEKSPAWQEAAHGQLWDQGEDGLKKYNKINKVEPMQRALEELNVSSWFSGLRRVQSRSRATRQFVEVQSGRIKMHPIVDWTDRDIHNYLKAHDLPYHPLWDQGYVSVGDVHTTKKLGAGMSDEEARFFGLFRECGLHT
ncbi:MAG: phosphoadenylyl-sulfate reductase [Pseudomonadota bacterium]